MKNIIIIFFVIALSNTINAQNRNIIWVHGLGGDASSWEHYDEIFDNERQVNGEIISYNTDNGVGYAGNIVYNRINDSLSYYEERDSRNMAIGHSMGGVVSRYLGSFKTGSNKRFGGIITVNSPNYGAPLINGMDDGTVISAAQDAAEKLSAGPLSSYIPTPMTIIGDITSEKIWKMLLTDELFDKIVKGQTRTDLKPGSYCLNYIKNSSSANSLPTINIWSQESSPVHWRMIDTYMGYGSSSSDADLAGHINVARELYHAKYLNYVALAHASIVIPGLYSFYMKKANKWKKGRDWIDGSEDLWSSIIETSRTEKQTYWVNVWVPCDYPPSKNPDPNCGHWEYQQRTRYVSVNYPSDGLLPKYTQVMDNISSGNVYEIKNANHTEVRNMSAGSTDETKDQFDLIFNRDDWFGTE